MTNQDTHRAYPTPEPSRFAPDAPPPSLVSSRNSQNSTKAYTRNLLLSLATPHAEPPPLKRLDSMQLRRKDSTSDWGIDEETSEMLDGQPISKSLPIPRQGDLVGVEGKAHPADLLFDYQSYQSTGSAAVPILVDFGNPDPFNKARSTCSETGSQGIVEEAIPSSILPPPSLARTIRLGSRTSSFSRSTSPSLSEMSMRKRSDSISSNSSRGSITGLALNPFAAPWPMPGPTSKAIIAETKTLTQDRSTPEPFGLDSSLPLPRAPSSLPRKPNCPLPPVFVKRESAALPQPMARPDVAPMGKEWEGEQSLSGNEKRRRASEVPALGGIEAKLGAMRFGQSLGHGDGGGDARPERLRMLGQGLRQSLAAQGGFKPGVKA